MSGIRTFIRKVGGRHVPHVSFQNQTFPVGSGDSYKEAQWTGHQFNEALKRNDIEFETTIDPPEQKLYPGVKVTYNPGYGKHEKGIVKSLPDDQPSYAFVVYNCGGNWEDYENYTAARTPISGLTLGWPDED